MNNEEYLAELKARILEGFEEVLDDVIYGPMTVDASTMEVMNEVEIGSQRLMKILEDLNVFAEYE